MQSNIGLKINQEKTTIHMISGSSEIANTGYNWTREPPDILGIMGTDADQQYLSAINKAGETLGKWSMRNISMLGKVTIVNTLVASLFIYLMQALPSPTNRIYALFDSLVHTFMWGKPKAKPKIPMNLLMCKKKEGGLNLINLRARDQSLKMQWLFRKEAYFEELLGLILPSELGTLMLDCTLHPGKIRRFINACTPPFWVDVLTAWFSCQYKKLDQIVEIEEIKNQIIWCNSHITSNGAPIYIPRCITKGLIYVSQLFEGGDFIEQESLENDFDLGWMDYLKLKCALPSSWIQTCKTWVTDEVVPYRTRFEEINQKKRKSAYIYQQLLCNDTQPLVRLHKRISVKLLITVDELTQAFRSIYVITNIVKYRDFQYRVLCLAVYGNDRLYHWKITDSQKCERCNYPKQDLFHMLYDCPVLQAFWSRLFSFCTDYMYCSVEIDTSTKALHLNQVVKPSNHLINFVVLVAKQYLYAAKCCNEPVKLRLMLRKLHELYITEKYNAITTGNLHKHHTKWQPFIMPKT